MGAKKRGLGRGLDALLGGAKVQDLVEAESDQELRLLPIQRIQPGPYQPRRHIRPEALQELADSIREQGVVQPILVRPAADAGRYEVIAGERRWRAAKIAELREIPVIVRRMPDRAALSVALIENIQREDLNPLEEANALARLVNEFKMSHQEAAEAVGRSRAAVSNLLRLRDLDDEVKALLENGEIEMGHGRALLSLSSDKQRHAARRIVDRGLSVRETERLVRGLLDADSKKPPPVEKKDPNIARLETELSEKLGARVAVRHAAKGKGTLVIHYHSLDELDGILEHIR